MENRCAKLNHNRRGVAAPASLYAARAYHFFAGKSCVRPTSDCESRGKRFLVHDVWHFGRVAAVVSFQHVNQSLARTPAELRFQVQQCFAVFHIDRDRNVIVKVEPLTVYLPVK